LYNTIDLKDKDVDFSQEKKSRTFTNPCNYLIGSCALSNFADGMSLSFLPIMASYLMKETYQISLIDALRNLPLLFLALPAGMMLDKLNRVLLVITLNICRFLFLLFLGYLAWNHSLTALHLMFFAVIIGSIEAFNDVALPTILPKIALKENFDKYNGLISSVESTANFFVGRTAGSLLISVVSQYLTVLFASIFYLASAIFMIPLLSYTTPYQYQKKNKKDGILKELKVGFSYVFRDRSLRYLAIMGVFGNACFGAILSTLIIYIKHVSFTKEWALGPIQASFALGSMISGLFASKILGNYNRWKTLIICSIIISFSILWPIFYSSWIVVACMLFVTGACSVLWATISNSYRQMRTPENLLGRVTAVFRMITWGATPIGALVSGPLINYFGYTSPYYFGFGLFLLNIPCAVILWRDAKMSQATQNFPQH
jgi:MFS family permease